VKSLNSVVSASTVVASVGMEGSVVVSVVVVRTEIVYYF